MNIDYSVVIRTVGLANDHYKSLLQSIGSLEPPPREVIVVIPDDVERPELLLGGERIIHCPRGMVLQRVQGIKACKSEYALVCDDDVAFSKDFVQKLAVPLIEKKADISIGPLFSFLPPKKSWQSFWLGLSASAAPTVFNRNKYITILKSSGWSYNRNIDCKKINYYYTDSAPWTCFFGRTDKLKAIEMEREAAWLDKYGYAYLDDQTMFYKAKLQKIKTVVVSNAIYEHLDARTSVKNKSRKIEFPIGFNRVVFWHRFIYEHQRGIQKVFASLAFLYYLFMGLIYNLFRQEPVRRRLYYKGVFAGFQYIKTKEYKVL